MAWYDVFSRFYDASLEPLYREQRTLAAEALALAPGSVVLDVPCGTGQSFSAFTARLGPEGRVLGVDLSPGMLREAERRQAELGLKGVGVLGADAGRLTLEEATSALDGRRPDRLHVFLGMSVFPEPDRVFENLWSLLAPGGLCVVVDVHTEELTFQGRMVNLLARADITRRFWEPLESVGEGFERRPLPVRKEHGGAISLAVASKPH